MSEVVCTLWGRAGLDRAAQGVLGAGRRLADSTGGKLRAIILGDADEALISGAQAVADRVVVATGPALQQYNPESYLAALTALCKAASPTAVLLGNDTYGQEIAARLAHRLGGSAAGDAVAVHAEGGKLRVTRGVYGGKATAVLELEKSPAVVWVRARAIEPADASGRSAGEVERVTPDVPATNVKVLERQEESKGGARLEDAQVIVSGGRGLGGPEPFTELQKLADVMHAQMAASRAACDAGWVPPSWQVGQTGKKVAPQLYLAIAISGASQHIMGIADSKVICAINRDADAPIFKHCTFGLVEDYQKVIGPLTERLRSAK